MESVEELIDDETALDELVSDEDTETMKTAPAGSDPAASGESNDEEKQ